MESLALFYSQKSPTGELLIPTGEKTTATGELLIPTGEKTTATGELSFFSSLARILKPKPNKSV